MKIGLKIIVAFFILLLACSLATAAFPHMSKNNKIDSSLDKGVSYKPSTFSGTKFYSPSIEYDRIGIVSGNVAKYKIKVTVGTGEYDYITLTNYVREKDPEKSDINKNLVILPGQALTEKFYSGMAVYFAQQGYSTYVLDRRETNIPLDQSDFSFMKTWTVEQQLSDIYQGIAASRIHTANLNGKPAEKIDLTVIGHSHGALLLTAYEASKYDDTVEGAVDRAIPVDIIIKYNPDNPENTHLIQGQAEDFEIISQSLKNGEYQNADMSTMLVVAKLALYKPNDPGVIQPIENVILTNMQVFRLFASMTYSLSPHPFTDTYHYWTGDLNKLYYVDEGQLLETTTTGGAAPYSPMIMDQYMAGLMGNIKGYEIEPSKMDSPVLYVGLSGGFGDYGSWWYKKEVGKTNRDVTSILWYTQGNHIISQGHASLLMDYNSPELWGIINDWINDESGKKGGQS